MIKRAVCVPGENQKSGVTNVPRAVIFNRRLSSRARFIYIVLLSAQQCGKSPMTQEQLADLAGFRTCRGLPNRWLAQRALDELVAAGLIRKQRGRPGQPNTYTIPEDNHEPQHASPPPPPQNDEWLIIYLPQWESAYDHEEGKHREGSSQGPQLPAPHDDELLVPKQAQNRSLWQKWLDWLAFHGN